MSTTMTPKDPNVAMIIEILAGFFGFLGIGYLYAGLTKDGLIRLVGLWIAAGIALVIGVLTLGIGLLCLAPVLLAAPIISGLMLKSTLERMQAGPNTTFPG